MILTRDVVPGGAKGTRTPDPVLAKHVLFQLSYSPECGAPRVPGARPGMRSPAAAPVVPAGAARPAPRRLRSGHPAAASGGPPASDVRACGALAPGASVPASARRAGNSVIRVMK